MSQITSDILVWGCDKYGQLGIDDQFLNEQYDFDNGKRPSFHSVPRVCNFQVVINQISCGMQHTALLTAKGHLYTMGSNLKGQLGIGSSSSVPLTMGSPTLVEKLKHLFVEQVSCGSDFTFTVARHKECLENKMVYSWGNNSKGQLAQDLSLHTQFFPLQVQHIAELQDDLIQISAGYAHVLLLTKHESVYSCGCNKHGQCAQNTEQNTSVLQKIKIEQVIQISAGFQHSLFLTKCATNQVYAAGKFLFNSKTNYPVPITKPSQIQVSRVIAGQHSAFITQEGNLYTWGQGTVVEPTKIVTLPTHVEDVALGSSMNLIQDKKGNVWNLDFNEQRKEKFVTTQVDIVSGQLVAQISCGEKFAICICLDEHLSEKVDDKQSNLISQQIEYLSKVKPRNKSDENLNQTLNDDSFQQKKQKSLISKISQSLTKKQQSRLNKISTSSSTRLLKKQSQDLEDVLPMSEQALSLLRAENSQIRKEYFKQILFISKLENKIEKLQSNSQQIDQKPEIQKLKLKVSKILDKNKQLEYDLAKAQSDIKLSKSMSQQFEAQLNGIQKLNHSLRDQIANLKSESEFKDTLIQDLQQQISSQNNYLQGLQSDLSESKQNLNDMKAKNSLLEQEIKNLSERIKKYEYESFVSVFSSAIRQSAPMQIQNSQRIVDQVQIHKQQAIEQSYVLTTSLQRSRSSARSMVCDKTFDQLSLDRVCPRRQADSLNENVLQEIICQENHTKSVESYSSSKYQQASIIGGSGSIRDKYSEQLVKAIESKALVRMQQIKVENFKK